MSYTSEDIKKASELFFYLLDKKIVPMLIKLKKTSAKRLGGLKLTVLIGCFAVFFILT